MEKSVKRDYYLEKLKKTKDMDVIKVLTGIRRCGKSVLLRQFMEYLLESGVKSNDIVYINFEQLEFENLLSYKELYKYISSQTANAKDKAYILLDEIQEVKNFEKVVNSLFSSKRYDIYITGSNSHLLSGELSTLLSDRFIEIFVLPFSFEEFMRCTQVADKYAAFDNYLRYGALPYLANIEDEEIKAQYLDSIYNTIVIKDLQERRSIKDVRLLRHVLEFLIDTIGNPISAKKISDTLTSSGYKSSSITISNYIQFFQDSFVLLRAPRYDVRGKNILSSLEKYYISDLGFRFASMKKGQYNLGSMLENVVYLELIRRGYRVFVGKIDEREIDFIAHKNDKTEYYQVSSTIADESVLKREIAPFFKTKDNYPKTIITLDRIKYDIDGIEIVNAIDWLLDI